MGRVAASLVLSLFAVGCGGGTDGPRIHERPRLGFRLPLAEGWVVLGEVLKSRSNSQLAFQVHSLEDAESQFMAAFPDSLIPQLEAWGRSSFGVIGEPVRGSLTISGVEALELAYPASARPGVEPGKLVYWIARKGDWVWILRATTPAGAPESDEAELRQMASAMELFEPGSTS